MKSQPAASLCLRAYDRKSFHLLTIISLTQTRPKSSFFFFSTLELHWSSEARVKDPMWLRSDSFRCSSLISNIRTEERAVVYSGLHGLHPDKNTLIKWHAVIKMGFFCLILNLNEPVKHCFSCYYMEILPSCTYNHLNNSFQPAGSAMPKSYFQNAISLSSLFIVYLHFVKEPWSE